MTKTIANAAVALTLMIGDSSVTPAFAGAKEQKCTGAGHSHAKVIAPGLKPRVGERMLRVERPRFDVRIVSFGP